MHPGFETQGRHHQKSKTEISVASLMTSKNLTTKNKKSSGNKFREFDKLQQQLLLVSCWVYGYILVSYKMRGRLEYSLPPANEVCEGYVFTGVCHSVHRGGVRGCSGGGRAWLLRGGGTCMVAQKGVYGFFDEIQSMNGRYASYWNAFLF